MYDPEEIPGLEKRAAMVLMSMQHHFRSGRFMLWQQGEEPRAIFRPPSFDDFLRHVKGEVVIGLHPNGEGDGTLRFVRLDFDDKDNPRDFPRDAVLSAADALQRDLARVGLQCMVSASTSGRGVDLWALFDQPVMHRRSEALVAEVLARHGRAIGDGVRAPRSFGLPCGALVEILPGSYEALKDREKPGTAMRLPFHNLGKRIRDGWGDEIGINVTVTSEVAFPHVDEPEYDRSEGEAWELPSDEEFDEITKMLWQLDPDAEHGQWFKIGTAYRGLAGEARDDMAREEFLRWSETTTVARYQRSVRRNFHRVWRNWRVPYDPRILWNSVMNDMAVGGMRLSSRGEWQGDRRSAGLIKNIPITRRRIEALPMEEAEEALRVAFSYVFDQVVQPLRKLVNYRRSLYRLTEELGNYGWRERQNEDLGDAERKLNHDMWDAEQDALGREIAAFERNELDACKSEAGAVRHLISITMGVGKTRQALQFVSKLYDATGARVWFLTPNHKIAADVERVAKEIGLTVDRRRGRIAFDTRGNGRVGNEPVDLAADDSGDGGEEGGEGGAEHRAKIDYENTLCGRPDAMRDFVETGLPGVQDHMCFRDERDDRGKIVNTVKCPVFAKGTCRYYDQAKQFGRVVVAPFDYLMITTSEAFLPRADLVIVDEPQPLAMLTNGAHFDQDELQEACRALDPLNGAEIGEIILKAVRGGEHPAFCLQAAGYKTSQITEMKRAAEQQYRLVVGDVRPDASDGAIAAAREVARRTQKLHVLLGAVLAEWPTRDRRDRSYAIREGYRESERELQGEVAPGDTLVPTLRTRYRRTPQRMRKDLPVIMLDGTPATELLRVAFGEFEHTHIEAEWQADVSHAYGRSYAKSVMRTNAYGDVSHPQALGGFVDRYAMMVRSFVAECPEDNVGVKQARVLVVCQKEFEDAVRSEINPVFTSSANVGDAPVVVEHFPLRGVNTFEDFCAVLVIGQMMPECAVLEDDIEAFMFDQGNYNIQRHETGQFYRIPRPFLPDEEQWPDKDDGRLAYVHADPVVERARKLIMEDEIVQALHRLRPVRKHGRRSQVLILNDQPMEDVMVLGTFHFRDLARQIGAKLADDRGGYGRQTGARVAEVLERERWLLLAPSVMAKMHPGVWRTKGAAKSDLDRMKREFGGAERALEALGLMVDGHEVEMVRVNWKGSQISKGQYPALLALDGVGGAVEMLAEFLDEVVEIVG